MYKLRRCNLWAIVLMMLFYYQTSSALPVFVTEFVIKSPLVPSNEMAANLLSWISSLSANVNTTALEVHIKAVPVSS